MKRILVREIWGFENPENVSISKIRNLDEKQKLVITFECEKLKVLYDQIDEAYACSFMESVSEIYRDLKPIMVMAGDLL